ncbi:MAG: VCBS repeat-containing protein [Planctomycetaceae bacterium]|nr:VCBS repeat-containing protein [Planctomycetaceae bacterium]
MVAVETQRSYAELDLGELAKDESPLQLPYVSDWVVAIGSFEHGALKQGEIDRGANDHDDKQSDAESSNSVEQTFVELRTEPDSIGGPGVMWADVDADGLPDVYQPLIFAERLPDLFLHNRGGGRFVEEGERRGIADLVGGSHGAAWCYLDNDGVYDLINGTTLDNGSGNANDLFRNDGTGHFSRFRSAALEARRDETRAVLCFDMDGDGDLDLFAVTGYLGSDDPAGERNEVYRNDGDFQFTEIDGGELKLARLG